MRKCLGCVRGSVDVGCGWALPLHVPSTCASLLALPNADACPCPCHSACQGRKEPAAAPCLHT
eukprot:365165-Chlamydomonas_euryale.AAC.6